MNQPSFQSLRDFVLLEIEMTTSDYALAFFKSEDKDKTKEQIVGRGEVRVRRAAVGLGSGGQESGTAVCGSGAVGGDGGTCASTGQRREMRQHQKRPPVCFYCLRAECRHYLVDCEKFKQLSPREKRQAVFDAKRCFNCLSPEHFVRDCVFRSKCRTCGPLSENKHATALHESYVSDPLTAQLNEATPKRSDVVTNMKNSCDVLVHKVGVAEEGTVLLRTCAVRVVNSNTGCSTLAYAQHDTASQATLISDTLRNELGLEAIPDPSITIRTLADQAASCLGRTNFTLQSLVNNDEFEVEGALVVPRFSDDESTLPHAVDTSRLSHFEGIKVPVIHNRKCVDILIGQSDRALLAVLKELEGSSPHEPSLIFTRLGPIASGGRVSGNSRSLTALKVLTDSAVSNCKACDELKNELVAVKDALREYNLLDEELLPSKSDELAYNLVEPFIEVKEGRYQMPVPFKSEVLKTLPNNYESALQRTLTMRRTASKNSQLKQTLIDTFAELLENGWIVPAGIVGDERQYGSWYLPFFVTRTAKPRVVYDGAATVGGASLNRAVLAGENLLNSLVDVLMRFRMGRFACVADVSKCFFQIKLPENQQKWFHIIWFKNNNIDGGETQVFRFTRHVWGINSSPYVALLAFKRLVVENPTGASEAILNVVKHNRYMDDVLFAGETLSNAEAFAEEGTKLFKSRGFRLRKWVTNSHAKSVLLRVPQCDRATSVGRIDIGSHPLPDSSALGLVWDPEGDTLRIGGKKFVDANTKREMTSQLASQFDPLGVVSPLLLGGKLILQKVAASKIDWDETLPDNFRKEWKKWLITSNTLEDYSIPRNLLLEGTEPVSGAVYQLHGFCDASDSAYSCVVYLRGLHAGKSNINFVIGKSKLVLAHQKGWVISRRELEAAELLSQLMRSASKALRDLNCSIHCWTDSQVVLKWIVNPDLSLARFVRRRVDRIHLVSPPDVWRYVNTSCNPADVGTRESSVKQPGSLALWLEGPTFLLQENVIVMAPELSLAVNRISCSMESSLDPLDSPLDRLIEAASNLYVLKKRCAYLAAFAEFMAAKKLGVSFQKPRFNATYLDKAFIKIVKYVQFRCFGAAVELLSQDSADAFESILKQLNGKAKNPESMRRLNELKALRNLRPCVGSDNLLRIEGRLENASALPVDTKHPMILPGRHPLTGLIVLNIHTLAGHCGPAYTLMKSRRRFWIIHGVSSVKHYIANCGKCALLKAKPIRQLMSDLPSCRVTICNKPFKFSGLDFLGPYLFRQGRSECKAWGLLFSCLCTRCLHVELVTSLDLDSFLLAFTRFTNLRGAVDTIYSDNASTFRAASDKLPELLSSTEFCNALRRTNINWIFIPPYAPSQGGSWESMVKLFKNALGRVLEQIRRKPSLIELQTFFSDAVRIVNDRPLTTPSDQPDDLCPITPSSFLGQHLAPNTPICDVHDKGDLRRDYIFNSTLAHRFWLQWMEGYLPTLQGRNKWKTL